MASVGPISPARPRSALNGPGQVREVRQAPAHPMTWVPHAVTETAAATPPRRRSPSHAEPSRRWRRPAVEAPRLEPERRRGASASPERNKCSSALSRAWRPNRSQSSSSDAGRLRGLGDSVPRAKPSRSLVRDAEEWSGVDRVGAGSIRDQHGKSGTTGPPSSSRRPRAEGRDGNGRTSSRP